MENLIKQAENLRKAISAKEKEIDNPVLVMSVKIELDNLIDFLKEED